MKDLKGIKYLKDIKPDLSIGDIFYFMEGNMVKHIIVSEIKISIRAWPKSSNFWTKFQRTLIKGSHEIGITYDYYGTVMGNGRTERMFLNKTGSIHIDLTTWLYKTKEEVINKLK